MRRTEFYQAPNLRFKVLIFLYQGSISVSSHSVDSDSLWPHGLQHTRPPYPSRTPRVCSISCPSCRWCHTTNFILCRPLLLPPSIFSSISVLSRVSSSRWVAKVMELQLEHQSLQWIIRTDFLYDGLVWSPCSPRDLQVFSNTTVQKHQFFCAQLSLPSSSHTIHDYWKATALTRWTFVGKVMSLLFNMLSRLVIAFLPRSKKSLLISWLQSPSAVILGPKKVVSNFNDL